MLTCVTRLDQDLMALSAKKNAELVKEVKEVKEDSEEGSEEAEEGGVKGDQEDNNCYECKVKYRDPRPKDLVMFLHAYTYSVRRTLWRKGCSFCGNIFQNAVISCYG